MSDDPNKTVKETQPAPISSTAPGAGEDLLRAGIMQQPDQPGMLGKIGRFDVIKLLGQGGMGQVLLAREPVTNVKVAIKVLKPQFARDAASVHRFLTEARHAYAMGHPHILKVMEVSDSDDRPFYVVPYVEGGSLARRIGPQKPLPTETALDIARQIASALSYAHGRGIIHRDLKPANVLVDGEGRAYLTDFGLLRTVFNDSFVDVQQSSLEGTAPYMSPAMVQGKAEDTRCDIYSFGAMLYEMLVGQPPYLGPSVEIILQNIAAGPPEPILKVNPKASKELAAIADRAMARELRDRYASMADVLADLERVAQGKDPIGPHGAEPQRKHLLKTLAIAAGGILLLGLLGFVISRAGNHRSAKSSNAGPRIGQRWTNSLGMVFVPVPGTEVLFSIWETRVQDFEAFVKDTGRDMRKSMYGHRTDGWADRPGYNWQNPGFPQTLMHPVVGVSWNDAVAFCDWLTKRERKEGRIGGDQSYRLPKDAEWSHAVGLTEDPGGLPKDKSGRVADQYPWGGPWPPPRRAGNYAGSEARNTDWPTTYPTVEDYNDGFERTAPVGSFNSNQFGLYDLGGNVWELCEDQFDSEHDLHAIRGGGWDTHYSVYALSSYREKPTPDHRCDNSGFRCVLAVGGAAPRVAVGSSVPGVDWHLILKQADAAYAEHRFAEALKLYDSVLGSQTMDATVRKTITASAEKCRNMARFIADRDKLPAGNQVEAIQGKLRELNPNYHGNGSFTIRDGQIEGASFGNVAITDCCPIAGLPLRELRLDGCGLNDIRFVAGMTNLTRLDIWGNRVTDISPLGNAAKLQFIGLAGNQISDFSPLTNLHEVRVLRLWQNPVTNWFSFSTYFPRLTELNLMGCELGSLLPLAGTSNLVTLNVAANRIVNLSPLASLTNLQWLNVRGNPRTIREWMGSLTLSAPSTRAGPFTGWMQATTGP